MTNVFKVYDGKHSYWIEFEKNGDPKESSFGVDMLGSQLISVTTWGPQYRDRDNYPTRESASLELDLTDTKALRDYLSEAIERMEREPNNVD